MNIPRLIVTREHGSWAVVIVPMVMAAGVAGVLSLAEVAVFVGVLSGFMTYVPLQTILRGYAGGRRDENQFRDATFWVAVFTVVGLMAGAALVLCGYSVMPLLAVAAGVFFLANFLLVRYHRRSVGSDFIAVAGLALSAPAMYYAATSRLDGTAVALWFVNTLFFGGSVFYVHMKMQASGTKRTDLSLREKLSIGKMNLLYHASALVAVTLLAMVRVLPGFAILAFVPMTVHAFVGMVRLSSAVRYKVLGLVLLAQSVVFAVLFVFAVHA